MSSANNSAFLSVSIATAFLTIAASSPARSQDLRSSVHAVTAGRARDSGTSPAYSVRAAIEREAARLADAGVRRTIWQQPVPPERNRVDRHRVAAGTLIGAATGTTWQQQAVQQERSWVGRHPALTGALIGAGVGATYAYILCRGQCEGQPGLYMMLFGGIGAGIGAGTGAIVGALRD